MKKKKIFIFIGLVVLIFIIFIGFWVGKDLKEEKKLLEVFDEINLLSNEENIDIEKLNQKLNTIETSGDYAKVEEAFKSYLKDLLSNITDIINVLDDEQLTNILTIENYKNDGKEFLESKEYLEKTINELENLKNEYNNLFDEEKVLSYIKSKNLDDYYIDLYKNEFVKDISASKDEAVIDNINTLISILELSQKIIDLLCENKNAWDIENENLVFYDDNVANKYEEYINELE